MVFNSSIRVESSVFNVVFVCVHDIRRENVHILNGNAPDLERECEEVRAHDRLLLHPVR